MKKITSTVWAWLIALGALGALAILPVDADAQSRGTGARSAPAGARMHAPGVRPHAPGVRSHTQGVRPHVSGARGHVFHHRPRVGVVIGAPFVASPWWHHPYPSYHDPYYYPPAVYVQEQPAVYIEQPAPAPPLPEQYWYYCEDSQTYYPYVSTCASPWQRVIPHAPQ